MADRKRSLNLKVLRNNRKVTEYAFSADPDDHGALEDELHDWLRKNGYAEGLWGSFTGEVRFPGSGKLRKVVQA